MQGPAGPQGASGPQGAQGPAGPAGEPGLAAGATTYARVAAAASTDRTDQFVDLGGPSLTVFVPASGTIQIAASVEVADDDGVVSLFQDGAVAPGLGDCGELAGTLFSAPFISGGGLSGPWGTPGAFGVAGCATYGPPGPVTIQTSPGRHTFSLRYASCDCTPDATSFSNRQLWATPMP